MGIPCAVSHSFEVGELILVAINGIRRRMRVVAPDVRSDAFPVVWVCSEAEWEVAHSESRRPEGMAWPLTDVSPMT